MTKMDKNELINKLSIISKRFLENEDNFIEIEGLLDERDEDDFSLQWDKEYKNVEKMKNVTDNKQIRVVFSNV